MEHKTNKYCVLIVQAQYAFKMLSVWQAMPESTTNTFKQNTDTYQVLNSSTKDDNVLSGFLLCCKMEQNPPNKQGEKKKKILFAW